MLLLIFAYLGGVLTIVSPCILPVLPFVFARADRPFERNGLPMLVGMALTFAAVASLAAVGGAWAVHANRYGRYAAMAVLAVFGVSLLSRRVSDWIGRPFVRLGSRLARHADGARDSVWAAAGLGVATGLLWAPCAGPILGLLLTAAALNGANFGTTLLLLLYATGAATSLALALAIGGRVFASMQRALGAGERVRRALGVLVLIGVAAIASGLDTGWLTRLSLRSTGGIEQRMVDALKSTPAPDPVRKPGDALPVEGDMPSLLGATQWLNSRPLAGDDLRGKVVVVDFWTYSCINCLRALPYVRAWTDKYRDHGLVVIGVHSPEFAFEKDVGNVRAAAARLGLRDPIAIDNDYAIWKAFRNGAWPAHYFVDARGRVRHHHFGEGRYAESEAVIQQLLAEAGQRDVPTGTVDPGAGGAQAAPSAATVSPETYLGYARSAVNAGGRLVVGDPWDYALPPALLRDQWAFGGRWAVQAQYATAERPQARVRYRFHARDVHLVMGAADARSPVRFRVRLDGRPPGAAHGGDSDAAGNGAIEGHRLYQLIRQDADRERLFEIEFLDPGAQVYAFTFG